jgi:hypothetical protein
VGDEPETPDATPEEPTPAPVPSATDETQEIPAVVVEPEPEPAPEPAVEPAPAEPEPAPAEPEPAPAEPEPAPAEPEPVAAEPEPVAAEPDPETATGIGPAHAKPGRSGWRTAGVVLVSIVALAAVAAAGVFVGRSTAPGPDIVVQPGPVVVESSSAEEMPIAEQPEPLPAARPSLAVARTGPNRATAVLTAAPTLADTPGTATGYRLVNGGISGAQVAGVLAATFGADGTPIESEGAWTVGADGFPRLSVAADPLFTWTFEDPIALASPTPGQQLRPGETIELASEILAGIGVDVSDVDWQVDLYADRTTAIAWQLVSGQRTQLSWQLSFDPDGAVVEASGFSAGLEPVPDYPVVGAATAGTRLGSAPWWALAPTRVASTTVEEPSVEPVSPTDSASASPAASGSASPTPTPSPSPTSDRPVLEVPVAEVTVTDAELGLAQYWQPDGSVLMLPSYTVTGEDGSRWSVLAIEDAYVDFTDRADPQASPS